MTLYPREECGVFGVFNHPEAANLTYLGLYALQHRGQESAGIAVTDGEKVSSYKQLGLVSEIFDEKILNRLTGKSAVGHVRYSTAGSNNLANAQPITVDYKHGTLAAVHNGNLVNAQSLRFELEQRGAIFQSTADTEVIIHLMAHSSATDEMSVIKSALQEIKGAYSLLMLTPDALYAAKDPRGFRPLCIGRLPGDAYAMSSESCAFDIINCEYQFSVDPGEVVRFDKNGIHRERFAPVKETTLCVFEYIYYARPDSIIFEHDVYSIRKELGKQLARECPVEADLVVPVPDSSLPAAIGYAHESGIPLEMGLIRNHYVGRTFIEPKQQIRDFGAKVKYNPVAGSIKGKRAVVVDDSIVRGTTGKKIIHMLQNAGAREIHMRISCPPWKYPCYFGINTPEAEELIANQKSIEEIARHLEVDTLGYLSLKGLMDIVPNYDEGYCKACFDMKYPVSPGKDTIKRFLKKA